MVSRRPELGMRQGLTNPDSDTRLLSTASPACGQYPNPPAVLSLIKLSLQCVKSRALGSEYWLFQNPFFVHQSSLIKKWHVHPLQWCPMHIHRLLIQFLSFHTISSSTISKLSCSLKASGSTLSLGNRSFLGFFARLDGMRAHTWHLFNKKITSARRIP